MAKSAELRRIQELYEKAIQAEDIAEAIAAVYQACAVAERVQEKGQGAEDVSQTEGGIPDGESAVHRLHS